MPDLELKWWWNDSPPEEIAKMEPEISRRLSEFRAFLEDTKNAEAIKAAIARINQEAGLPPVADEKPVEAPAPAAGGKGGE